MQKQFLFINEQSKIQKLFKDFLGFENATIVNNEFMFLMTGMIDGYVFKIEETTQSPAVVMYATTNMGTTYRGSNEVSLLQKAGKLVKHILEIRSANKLKQNLLEVDAFVTEQDCLESFGKEEGLEKLVITRADNGGGLEKLG